MMLCYILCTSLLFILTVNLLPVPVFFCHLSVILVVIFLPSGYPTLVFDLGIPHLVYVNSVQI